MSSSWMGVDESGNDGEREKETCHGKHAPIRDADRC